MYKIYIHTYMICIDMYVTIYIYIVYVYILYMDIMIPWSPMISGPRPSPMGVSLMDG